MPSRAQHRRMHALWRQAGITGVTRRADRLALTAALIGRPITSSNELTVGEADMAIEYMQRLDDEGLLADRVGTWLALRHTKDSAS
jgi:hypothetical protein